MALVGEDKLAEDEALRYAFINNQMLAQIANNLKRYDILEYIFRGLVEQNPNDSDPRVNLAAAYYEQGNVSAAVAVLEKAIEDIPAFKEEGEKLLRGIEVNDGN